jgi:predicted ATPase
MLARCRCFHFHDTSQTAPMRLPSYVNDNLNLRPDAANLAAMLHLYHERYPVVYRRIVGAVRQLVPSFDAFVLEPQRLDPNRIRLDWRQSDRDYLFGPHQLSDGTLRTIALATLFLQPEEDLPTVIVLDEPELGLHPNAIESIAGLIRSVSHRSQVILATQSVALVDCFAPGEIIVSAARGGASTFERLSADPLEDWLRDYSLGELWQRNVIPAGPLA